MIYKTMSVKFLENLSSVFKVFMIGVTSVQPREIVKHHVKRDGEKLVIGGTAHRLKHNVYTVGFGKAVAGMVKPIEDALKITSSGSHLQKGIISVPVGMKDQLHLHDSDTVEYLEGAKDNIPDEDALTASKKIVSLVQSLQEQDLLLVLISGGGSALLPYPIHPLTLDEKLCIVKSLSRAGATITELNTVRKALSYTKGGRLAQMTKARTVSLLLSDVIGNRLDVIASGPTVLNADTPEDVMKVLHKYNIPLTDSVKEALKSNERVTDFSHVQNITIGSIEIALTAIETSLRKTEDDTHKNCALVLSSSLQGEASEVGVRIADFAAMVTHAIHNEHLHDDFLSDKLLSDLCIDSNKRILLKNAVRECHMNKCPLWLIFGGETTVTVAGSGSGGRNQEMVLSAAIHLDKCMEGSPFEGEVIFMSGGTDGVDGPTDAAGAITYWTKLNGQAKSQITEAKEQSLTAEKFLQDNDSYTFFSRLSSGQYHLKPGHTGTNVMDIQILLINPL